MRRRSADRDDFLDSLISGLSARRVFYLVDTETAGPIATRRMVEADDALFVLVGQGQAQPFIDTQHLRELRRSYVGTEVLLCQ